MFCLSCAGNMSTPSYSKSHCKLLATALRTVCCNEPSRGNCAPGRLVDCSTRWLVKMVESRDIFACLLANSQLAGGGGPGILRSLTGPRGLITLFPTRGRGGGVSGRPRVLLKEGWMVAAVGVCGRL